MGLRRDAGHICIKQSPLESQDSRGLPYCEWVWHSIKTADKRQSSIWMAVLLMILKKTRRRILLLSFCRLEFVGDHVLCFSVVTSATPRQLRRRLTIT